MLTRRHLCRPVFRPGDGRDTPVNTSIRWPMPRHWGPFVSLLLLVAGFGAAAPRMALADSSTTTAVVTSPDGLNLRTGPGTTYSVVTVIPSGATVAVTGSATADNWLPVQYNGQAGWADGAYLTLSGGGSSSTVAAASPSPTPSANAAAAAPAPTTAAPTTATVVPPDGLNLRTGPGTTYGVVAVVPGGTTLTITGAASNGWAPASFDGASGWVDTAFIVQGSGSSTLTAAALSSSAGAALGPAAGSGSALANAFGNVTFGTPGPPEAGLPVATPPAGSTPHFIWPVASRRISTVFSAGHQAIDIDEFPSGGNPVHAIADGIVTYAGGEACCSYGLYVIVQHTGGWSSLYAHFSSVSVSVGQVVVQGQQLGVSGCTGRCTGPHVHFAIYYQNHPLDPLTVLPPGAQIE